MMKKRYTVRFNLPRLEEIKEHIDKQGLRNNADKVREETQKIDI